MTHHRKPNFQRPTPLAIQSRLRAPTLGGPATAKPSQQIQYRSRQRNPAPAPRSGQPITQSAPLTERLHGIAAANTARHSFKRLETTRKANQYSLPASVQPLEIGGLPKALLPMSLR